MIKKSRLRGAMLLGVLLSIGSSCLHATESEVPEPFQGEDPRSKLSIGYADLDAFIKPHFFQSGPSTRAKAPKSSNNMGTRFKVKVNRYTALEGNRFYFKNLENPEVVAILSDLVESLEAFPDQTPLNLLNRNEQLAYWLNLYNFALLEELSQVYPKTSLKNVLDYGDDDSILAKKVLKVSGVSLSLNDIQYNIVYKKFPEKHNILYGFFQGNIGGPNIREKSYEGDSVWRALEENGKRFVNSNRGTAVGSSGKVRVSELYEHNMMLFNNDKEILRDHLQDLAIGDVETALAAMKSAKKIDFDIVDWNFADLFGDQRNFGGGNQTNPAALLDSVKSSTINDSGQVVQIQSYLSDDVQSKAKMDIRFSDSELETLLMLKQNRNQTQGTVEIKDIKESKNGK
ncbi:DUF547 domain-containing protein [Brumicola nitratireducens]|uniref:DUF547 domain-containing protein n=1 Tax=Glaciecola nitratireducens (strain JCM 12485 / KCTC 12276 / FR1064) TaxID=1085623 RepID=G4QIB2_GLANF|nr:DUF547 domain-containing protein [Glaciecola nitratireducens]AEP30726.1 hypothetical protein GNIT_2629 [Glaciecola nitratireducens FR1064]